MTVKPAEGDDSPIDVRVSAVCTADEIFFLVSWPDESKDDTHKTWVWNETAKAYQEGPDREDVVALAFAHTGVFSGDMLDGQEAVWDVWQWKAARTGPSGHAMDKTHRYTKAKPEGSAKSFEARDGSTIWIARPEDAGDPVEKKQPAPSTFTEERVSQYIIGSPKGSAADVHSKGQWGDGRWTVEFSRKIDTGNADDTSFAQGIPVSMSVAVFDHVEHIHHRVAQVWELEVFRN